ncbi:hypothetical protein [Comamonas testosteroni]|uniref:hypothetical protein n=1 Tax=Comamonas testosteroni TaxID=285 RepID=UPI0005B48994|nr:hypothetical protein [Comamonas testosteroni]
MERFLEDGGGRKEQIYAREFLNTSFSSVELVQEGAKSSTARLTSGDTEYSCVIHSSQSRADRVLPQLALALLQARQRKGTDKNAIPLPLVVVGSATLTLFTQVKMFAAEFLEKNEALGVLSMDGASCFIGEGVRDHSVRPTKRGFGFVARTPINLFTDTHQWLLKVLLAEHFPEKLLTANRGPFTSGRQLADAANVSPVTANRFLQVMKEMGFLDTTDDLLKVIRHKELFLRWRAAANESRNEVAVRFLWRSELKSQLQCLLEDSSVGGVLGLFEAAELMGLGHVSGMKPHVYVPKLAQVKLGEGSWESLALAAEGTVPDFYLRQAPAPISIFNGSVQQGGIRYTDVIQTWLDVSYHPSRGQEQANLIQERYLINLFEQHLG